MFPEVGELKTVVLISGAEGSGKTRWAVEKSPGPHYIIETEGEHNLHTAKEVDPEVRALVLVEDMDTERDPRWFSGRGTLWDKFRKAVAALLEAPPGTVIIDSATDLVAMVVGQLTIEWDRGEKAFPTMLYGQVYAEIGTHIAHLRKRHNVVLTSRVKEIYKGDEPTGRFKTAIWKQAEYIVEHTIHIVVSGSERVFHTKRLKQFSVEVVDLDWDWLVNGIPEEAVQERLRSAGVDRVKKAVKAIEDLGSPVPEKYSDPESMDLEELRSSIEDLTVIYRKIKEEKSPTTGRRRPS